MKKIDDLAEMEILARKIKNIIKNSKMDGFIMLQNPKTYRTAPFFAFSSPNHRDTYIKFVYGLFYSLIAMATRDMEQGEKDVDALNFQKAIETSKKAKTNYIG